MDIIPTERARVFGCHGCGGIWLDGAAAEIVKWAGLHGQLIASARWYDALEPKDPGLMHAGNYRESPRGSFACPICQRGLEQKTYPGDVDVDVCPTHGTFFDQRELRSLHDAVTGE